MIMIDTVIDTFMGTINTLRAREYVLFRTRCSFVIKVIVDIITYTINHRLCFVTVESLDGLRHRTVRPGSPLYTVRPAFAWRRVLLYLNGFIVDKTTYGARAVVGHAHDKRLCACPIAAWCSLRVDLVTQYKRMFTRSYYCVLVAMALMRILSYTDLPGTVIIILICPSFTWQILPQPGSHTKGETIFEPTLMINIAPTLIWHCYTLLTLQVLCDSVMKHNIVSTLIQCLYTQCSLMLYDNVMQRYIVSMVNHICYAFCLLLLCDTLKKHNIVPMLIRCWYTFWCSLVLLVLCDSVMHLNIVSTLIRCYTLWCVRKLHGSVMVENIVSTLVHCCCDLLYLLEFSNHVRNPNTFSALFRCLCSQVQSDSALLHSLLVVIMSEYCVEGKIWVHLVFFVTSFSIDMCSEVEQHGGIFLRVPIENCDDYTYYIYAETVGLRNTQVWKLNCSLLKQLSPGLDSKYACANLSFCWLSLGYCLDLSLQLLYKILKILLGVLSLSVIYMLIFAVQLLNMHPIDQAHYRNEFSVVNSNSNGQLVYLCPVVIKVDTRLSRALHFRSWLGCIEAQTIPGLCCLSSKLNVFFMNVSHLPVKTTVEIHTTTVLTVTTVVITLFVRIRATPNNCIIAVLEISVASFLHIIKLFSGNYGQDKSRAGCTEVQAVRDLRCRCYRVHFPNRLLKLSIS